MRRFWLVWLLSMPTFFFIWTAAVSQVNLLGKPGYVMVPSAEWESEQGFTLFAGYLPVESTINTSSYFNYDGIYYGGRVGLTSFLEVSLNITYHFGKERVGIGDRQMDARLRLRKESKNFPAVAVILSVPVESNNLIAYNALSLTKNFRLLGKTTLQLTGGYGSTYFLGTPYGRSLDFYPKRDVGNRYLNGFFGGMSWKPVPWLGILADYDSRALNAGLWLGYKDRVGVQLYGYGMKHFGGSAYLRIPLNQESRELRRYRKSLPKTPTSP